MVIVWVVIHFIAACLLMMLVNWIGLRPWRQAKETHWTEQARLLWPVRSTALFSVFLLPILLNQFQWYLFPQSEPNLFMEGPAAFLGALLGCYPLDRQMFPESDFKNWCHQVVAWWGWRFGIWIGLIVAIFFMPPHFGGATFLVAGGYLLFWVLLNWGFLIKYLRVVRFATAASPRLQQIVQDSMAKAGGVKVRATWEIGGCLATAFAFPTTHELLFSRKTLSICTDEEVGAICAHELAHLKESKIILAGRLLGSLAFFPLIFVIPLMIRFGVLGLFPPYILMFVLLRFTKWISMRMEKRADTAALTEQVNEGVYARALEKLYRTNLIPAVNINNRQTHPHLYDRMVAAGITPDFPRPERAKRMTWAGWALVVLLGVYFGLYLTRWQ